MKWGLETRSSVSEHPEVLVKGRPWKPRPQGPLRALMQEFVWILGSQAMGLLFSVWRIKWSTRHRRAKFFPGHFASCNSLHFGGGRTDLGVSADAQCLKVEASQPGTICHPFFTSPVLSSLLQLPLTPPFFPVTCCSLSLALPLPPYCARFLFLNHLYEVCEAVSDVCTVSDRSTRWLLP